MMNDLIEALCESSHEYIEDGPIFVGEDSICRDLARIEGLVRRVAESKDVLFLKKKHRLGFSLSYGSLGESVLRLIWHEDQIKKHYPLHRFSPYVEAFFKASQDFRSKYIPPGIQSYFGCDLDGVVRSLNGVVEEIRKTLSSNEFRAEINRHRRSSNKNYKSLVKYVDALFKLRSRLLVLRLDFGYAKAKQSNGFYGRACYSEAKKHRERLLVEIKRKLPKGVLVGFCWKLEFGLSKSYHYHFMFFLDGAKVREDISLGRMIGELWQGAITAGKGVYFNCNHKKDSYRACGIGMINHDNVEMRSNLLKAAMYLTKLEFYIKIVLEGKGRSFGRGEMPDLSRVGRGRPRKLASDDR